MGRMAVVEVAELTKTFVVPEREAGLRASIKALVRRKHREVHAVEEISSALAFCSGIACLLMVR